MTEPQIYLRFLHQMPGRQNGKTEHEAGLSLLSHGLRELTGSCLSQEELTAAIRKKEKGKPYLPGSGLSYNISHSHGLVCCGIASGEIGIDAELIRPPRENLARRVLSPSEYEQYSRAGEASDEVFMRFWTLKEAYGKYSGKGIAYHLDQTDFLLPGDPPFPEGCMQVIAPPEDLHFYQWLLSPGYIVSLCCSSSVSAEQIRLHILP